MSQYAGFWSRFLAVLIDGIILGVVNVLLGSILGTTGLNKSNENLWLGQLLSFALSVGYYVYYQAKAGQTIGKRTMKIKVVTASGTTPSMMTFFLREIIGKIISALVFCLGYLWMLWDPRKQTWHDKIASTFVIKVGNQPAPSQPAPVPSGPAQVQ